MSDHIERDSMERILKRAIEIEEIKETKEKVVTFSEKDILEVAQSIGVSSTAVQVAIEEEKAATKKISSKKRWKKAYVLSSVFALALIIGSNTDVVLNALEPETPISELYSEEEQLQAQAEKQRDMAEVEIYHVLRNAAPMLGITKVHLTESGVEILITDSHAWGEESEWTRLDETKKADLWKTIVDGTHSLARRRVNIDGYSASTAVLFYNNTENIAAYADRSGLRIYE